MIAHTILVLLWTEERIQFKWFMENIQKAVVEHCPDIVHAHTPYRVGIPAMKVARMNEIPFVYEMRGIWEDTAVANGRWKRWGLAYRRFKRMETKVLRSADKVYCISEQLRNDAINRGVDIKKISVIRNAVNEDLFLDEDSEDNEVITEIRKELILEKGTSVIGYIGSIQPLDGLD